jgi:L-threonylcarbamoyladenylate synthase
VAPSANVFCHVSPTSPVHVFNDLYDQELSIIDDAPTEFGIESTVLKVVSHKELQILRNGSVSAPELSEALKDFDLVIRQKIQY